MGHHIVADWRHHGAARSYRCCRQEECNKTDKHRRKLELPYVQLMVVGLVGHTQTYRTIVKSRKICTSVEFL